MMDDDDCEDGVIVLSTKLGSFRTKAGEPRGLPSNGQEVGMPPSQHGISLAARRSIASSFSTRTMQICQARLAPPPCLSNGKVA